MESPKQRSPRNRTLVVSADEQMQLATRIKTLDGMTPYAPINTTINQDFFGAVGYLPESIADLIVLDPPYNIPKNYNGLNFKEQSAGDYAIWFESIITKLLPLLKEDGTIYVCSDWKTSMIIGPILTKILHVRNRITWEREKGRGAKTNWKNNTEDIWFCTKSNDYYFDVDAVKLKRKVIAPYRDKEGIAKDWETEADGNFRLTYPSNIWTDITIPFWSMPENTDHPTQKPEKLIAKLILASTKKDGVVLDPFLGSGTTSVVAKKLGRGYIGIEQNLEYCCWAEKRLEEAADDSEIQGYKDGVFWERNSLAEQK